ncbi:MAG: gliding motility lipoprotein GldH [Bacteroidetes bacterium]|nr:gliding motility lipoprotein GldH [Bacteroidota bacterium]
MFRFIRFIHIMLFISLVALFVTSSCTKSLIYQKHKKIPDFNWTYEYAIPFNFTIKDSLSKYNTFFNLRTSSRYPYSNIWIRVKKFDRNGAMISDKKYEFILADIDGRWFGQGLGDIIDNKIPLEKSILFEHSGEYSYYVNHEMRSNTLTGIMDVGLSVEKDIN